MLLVFKYPDCLISHTVILSEINLIKEKQEKHMILLTLNVERVTFNV